MRTATSGSTEARRSYISHLTRARKDVEPLQVSTEILYFGSRTTSWKVKYEKVELKE